MNYYKQINNACYYSSIEDVPTQIWEDLKGIEDVYLDSKYLSAIAKHHKNIDFYYVFLQDESGSFIAFSTIQIVSFNIESVQKENLFSIEYFKCLFEKLHIFSTKKPAKVLTIGNTFVSGDHGIFIKDNQDKQKVIKELAKSVVHFVNSNEVLKNEVKAYMLKDFINESLEVTDQLHEANYYSFNVDPNMSMEVDITWDNFTDYLAAMKTKFRVKAKKAMERSLKLETVNITEHNLSSYIDQMNLLYENVSSKADFNLGKFNLNSFSDLKKNLRDDYIIKGYFLNEKMVGFLSAMVSQNNLDAHFVGIDYKYNKEYAVYQRILYDYIAIAIQRNLKVINFGRTASEIKSSVGAVPQDLTIYLRHKKSVPNKFLSLLLNNFKPTPFNQKFPFKAKELVVKS